MSGTEDYVFVSTSEIKTVRDVLDVFQISMSSNEFMSHLQDINKKNIELKYDTWDITNNNANLSIKGELTEVKVGTTLIIPKNKIKMENVALFSEGQVAYYNNEIFLGKHGALLQNSKYVRANKTIIENDDVNISLLNENCQVWWYNAKTDRLINITPFIINIQTSKVKVGSFSIDAASYLERIEDIEYKEGDILVNLHRTEYDDNIGKMNWLERDVQKNDVIFIRFEELELDKDGRKIENKELVLPFSYLSKEPSHCWDMIGFVDKISISYTASNNDIAINISGRDFTKIFEDDGSYFLPYQFIASKNNSSKFVWGGDENSTWFRRNMVSGDYNNFFSYEQKSIEDSLKFIINHLSGLGITPDRLWASYKNKIAETYQLNNGVIEKNPVKGIWQIVQLNFDESVLERRITGENLINPSGSLMSFVNQICCEPFVECIMDTYEDELDIIVRQPPFTEKALLSIVDNESYIIIDNSDVLSYSLESETEFYSFYKINPGKQNIGNEDGLLDSIIPIIPLPFYSEKFGNKGYIISDPYIHRLSIEGDNGEQKNNTLKSLIDGLLSDLLFVIETTMYLPFTRRGTITINGDRRIKVGSFIKFNNTNELFYVSGVSQSMSISSSSIDRVTTLTVERGLDMFCLHHRRQAVNVPIPQLGLSASATFSSHFSYFDLVNIDKLRKSIESNIEFDDGKVKAIDFDAIVRRDVFEYFTQREV